MSQGILGPALQGQLELLCGRGFMPTVVHMDPQNVLHSLTSQYPAVVIDAGGAGDYISMVW